MSSSSTELSSALFMCLICQVVGKHVGKQSDMAYGKVTHTGFTPSPVLCLVGFLCLFLDCQNMNALCLL